jgi:hypothetical protein
LTNLPAGSFDTSSITSVGNRFFDSFNRNGKITTLPASFKRPALTQAQANQTGNFEHAFNSPHYTLNRNAADLINGAATPNVNRSTFSYNQPGLCDIDDNWKVDPLATCTPAIESAKPTDIQITAEITSSGQTVTINKYFANVFDINW